MKSSELSDAQIALQLYSGYSAQDLSIFAEFLPTKLDPREGFVTDFLGTRTRITSLWKGVRHLDGQVLPIPVPGDYHAEAIEWIGLLKAVRTATHQYVAMELGAGFGPWTIAGAVAARSRSIKNIRLCAVEGDPEHFTLLRKHFVDNQFDPDKHRLIQAAVGTSAGKAHWPAMDHAEAVESWGARPMDTTSDYTGRTFSKLIELDVIAMRDLVVAEPVWDLVHIDVQGHEVAICTSCAEELNARVRWLIIGTHSRKIDGDLLDLFTSAGWILEHEKPAKFTFTPNPSTLESMTTLDGTQVWRNPRLMSPLPLGNLISFSQLIVCREKHLVMDAGGYSYLPIAITNAGSESWIGLNHPRPVTAGYRWQDTYGAILPIEGKRALFTRSVLLPGESMTLELPITAPAKAGSYTLLISLVQEGVAWFMDRGGTPARILVSVR